MTDTLRDALELAAVQIEELVQMPYNRLTIRQAEKWANDARRAALAAAPQPAPGRDDNFQLSGTKVESPAQPPTSVDRDALVEVIRDAILDGMGSDMGVDPSAERAADALPARGLRLAGNETMAWAVVGDDGKVVPTSIWPTQFQAQAAAWRPTERAVRVAIRVVEGGDDAL